MPTTLLVFSTLAILAACSQDGSTSPAQSRSPNARASQDATPNGQAPGASAKPAYFTTITQVTGAEASWDGVGKIYGASVATCPAGAKVTGGGYTMYGAETAVMYNAPFGPDAWRVYGVSHASGSVTAYAVCVQ